MKKWMGYVYIRLIGLDIERQLQKILASGVVLNNCTRESLTSFTAWVSPWQIKRIKKLGVQVKLIRRGGAASKLSSVGKRWGIMVGAALWLAVILLIQGRVFLFNVSGTEGAREQEILNRINSTALIGRQVDGQQMEQMEQQILSFGDMQWVSVSKKGLSLEIAVKEKQELPEGEPKAPGDIVASKVGLLQEVITLQGMPVAVEGKLVLPGDVIISGQLIYAGEPASYVAAMGKCMAKVWYSAEKEVSLTREVRTPTGRTFSQKSVCIMQTEYGAAAPPFEHYSVTEIKKPLASMGIPIFAVERIYTEETVSAEKITPEQALSEHKEELEKEIKSILPDCQVLEISFYVSEAGDGAIVGASAVTLEDIGVFKPQN